MAKKKKADLCEANSGKVFRRIEKKYLITDEQKEKFLKICKKNLKKNKYFESTVCSIYFDTKDNDLIIKQIDKPVDKPDFKEKVRVRSYNVPEDEDYIFFEIKTKHREGKDKIGDKRRFQLLLSDYYDWLDEKRSLIKIAEAKIEKTNDVQIAREIEYIINYLNLSPKIFIACERQSYEGKDDSSLRVTIDQNLRYRTEDLDLKHGAEGKNFFNDEKNTILEIKTARGMPFWLVHALNELRIFPQPFSKYGKIYQQMKGENINVQYYL
ncbi:polyphosphate polymerase domain-containing protein [Candidatus Saccharibacteria bacterium]|nr:polyphosphate polymerase domain-containing protein [Candidatus Saccharibacteria bacterium]